MNPSLPPARREALVHLLGRVLPEVPSGVTVFLVGDTSHLWEGWLDHVPQAALAVEGPDAAAVREALLAQAARDGVAVLLESPGEIVPLPAGVAERHRAAAGAVVPAVRHFDPYSVAFRVIARGDEPDYHTVLRSLRHGWIAFDEMTRLLDEVLPRFTLETIAQDPAEFRRKYRGLTQMWRAERGDAARLFGAPAAASERAPAR